MPDYSIRLCYARTMRVLAIDFGERRLGLAVSDPTGTLARPWRTLVRRGSDEAVLAELAHLVETLAAEEGGLEAIVIGWPRRLDGSPHPLAPRIEQFGRALAARVGRPVVFRDERLTSYEAEARLAERERDWRRRKRVLDAAAAAVILQEYLDERAAATGQRTGGADGARGQAPGGPGEPGPTTEDGGS